jgi:hypothetical protein
VISRAPVPKPVAKSASAPKGTPEEDEEPRVQFKLPK